MENIDINTEVHPDLLPGAIVMVDDKLFQIEDINYDAVLVVSPTGRTKINEYQCIPVILDKNWLQAFNLSIGTKIHDIQNNVDWTLNAIGLDLHLNIYLDSPHADIPVIGLKFVHELQAWYYRLTGQRLLYNWEDN